ncbi:MAG: TrpB-like pyridoxal-phosphate dependent enzyme, partial [Actinomycetota bacterium]
MSVTETGTRWTMSSDSIPEAWFNVLPHLPSPLQPPLHPATREPVGPEDLAPLFPMALIGQEVSQEPWVDIPGEVLDILRLWRPTPLMRARRLEADLDTPARIYYKDESVSPAGAHKTNTAIPKAFN